MNRVHISNEDQATAKTLRFEHPHPRVQVRMEVLWLESLNLPRSQVSKLAAVSPNTVRRYLQMYKDGGIANLKQVNFNRPQSQLADHRDCLESYFREHPVASIAEAITVIEELTGIRRKAHAGSQASQIPGHKTTQSWLYTIQS